jgi:hypothetical protein
MFLYDGDCYDKCKIDELVYKTIIKIEGSVGSEELIFVTSDNTTYMMFSEENGCGNDVSVSVDDICGDMNDLIGSPILHAEEVINDNVGGPKDQDNDYSYIWTFYKLSTIKGYVTIRWYSSSNGCYSERVEFVKILK